jgi:hypothetical protein
LTRRACDTFRGVVDAENDRNYIPVSFRSGSVVALRFGQFEYARKIRNREILRKLYSEPVLSDESSQRVS